MKRGEVTSSQDKRSSPSREKATNSDSPAAHPDNDDANEQGKDTNTALELEMLNDRLQQRDSEIRILLRMMKQERKRADRAEFSLRNAGIQIRSVSPASPDRISPMRLGRGGGSSALPVSAAQASSEGGSSLSSDVVENNRSKLVSPSAQSSSSVTVQINRGGSDVASLGSGGGMVDASTSRESTVANTSKSSYDSAGWKATLKTGVHQYIGLYPHKCLPSILINYKEVSLII